MDQHQCRGKLQKNFQDHWSIRISPGQGVDQWSVHMNFSRNSYGPMALKVSRIATRAAIYRSLRALRARNRKKVSKQVFWGVCRKVPKNTRKSPKIPKKVRKSVFWDFFGYFRDFSADPPKDLFWDFFAISGPEGPETPVNGGSGRNSRTDPCSVDFGCEAPKFWFEFRCGFLGGSLPPVSSKEKSETGRIRFQGARFQTPNSVSFSGLNEFWGANSVSSSQPIICVPKRTHRVFRRTHRVCRRTQWVLSSETVLSKQYSARFLKKVRKIHLKKITRKIRLGIRSEKFPSDFCRSPFLKSPLKVSVLTGIGPMLCSSLLHSEEENPPEKNPPKIKKFIWTSFSEQFLLGSWFVSQGRGQKFARTSRESSRKRGVFLVLCQKNSRRPHGRLGQGPGSVDPRFPAGLPFPVPEILEFVAFRDSGKVFQQFSRDFPGVFLENPRTDPGNSHSLLEFSDFC